MIGLASLSLSVPIRLFCSPFSSKNKRIPFCVYTSIIIFPSEGGGARPPRHYLDPPLICNIWYTFISCVWTYLSTFTCTCSILDLQISLGLVYAMATHIVWPPSRWQRLEHKLLLNQRERKEPWDALVISLTDGHTVDWCEHWIGLVQSSELTARSKGCTLCTIRTTSHHLPPTCTDILSQSQACTVCDSLA